MKNDDGACQNGNICLTSEYGPITAKSYLSSSTINWTKLNQSQIKLPTANQILTASGKSFNGEKRVDLTKKWIYSNMYVNVAPFGYWTSTPSSSSRTYAFALTSIGSAISGSLTGASISGQMILNGSFGVRPVITVSKSNLS